MVTFYFEEPKILRVAVNLSRNEIDGRLPKRNRHTTTRFQFDEKALLSISRVKPNSITLPLDHP